jgi:hypothetical protein
MNRDEQLNDLFELAWHGQSPTTGVSLDLVADAELLVACDRELRRHRPEPAADFAQRVMARASADVVSARAGSWRSTMVASGSALLAASLLIAVTLSSKEEPAGEIASMAPAGPALAEQTPAPEKVSVTDAVRQGTVAYMELVDELTATLSTTSPSTASVERTSTSPLGRAVEDSSRTIRTAGEGLRVSVEPITSSAMDAFGFLWRPSGSTENKPST